VFGFLDHIHHKLVGVQTRDEIVQSKPQHLTGFLATPTISASRKSMDFSYKNPENKILSEIHNFQSQIHEIIDHDLSANLTKLIGKVVTDIAYMMIPQFLKHCVGLKRPDLTPEEAIAAWLNTDDQKLTVKDKQKMWLFVPGKRK
jgi:superfamily I DNA/RNA helicase